jgi:hypothetical protein
MNGFDTAEREGVVMRPEGHQIAERPFKKDYTVAIDTVPLPESPQERIHVVIRSIAPVMNEIIADAMTVAIGTWPTPELPEK